MIKYNNSNINEWNFGSDNIAKVYYGVQGSQPRLPSGYTEVEYVENTGTSYINTALQIYSSTTDSFEIESKLIAAKHDSQTYQNVFSCMSEDGEPYQGFAYRYQSSSLVGTSIPNGQNTFTIVNNEDSTQTVTVTSSSSQRTYTHTYPLTLFCGLNSSRSPFRWTNSKFYYCKIKINDELVRDLVPCKRDSDNKYGMYDIVNDVFYVSPNGNNFVAGSAVTPSSMSGRLVYQKITNGSTPPTPTFQGKWLATYTGGTTSSAECDATSAITAHEITLTDLESVEIGDCVTYIDDMAFRNCGSITGVTIPNSVTSIGQNAFYQCFSLTSIDIPNSVTYIGLSAFYSCSGLTAVTIGSGVTSIGNSAFGSCYSIPSIDIPNSVTSIGQSAFNSCSGLTTVTIGSGVTSIGKMAFRHCSGLTGITINATNPPTLGDNVFQYTNDCPIYVPSASVSAYQSAWSTYSSRITAIP